MHQTVHNGKIRGSYAYFLGVHWENMRNIRGFQKPRDEDRKKEKRGGGGLVKEAMENDGFWGGALEVKKTPRRKGKSFKGTVA